MSNKLIIAKKMLFTIVLLILFGFSLSSASINENFTSLSTVNEGLPIVKCIEKDQPISSKQKDLFTLVDVPLGKEVLLQCHFCKENDDKEPKVWFQMVNTVNGSIKEIEYQMSNDISSNRVHVTLGHSLVIRNVSRNDSAVYLCKGFEVQMIKQTFEYFIDLVYDPVVKDETGDAEMWKKYNEENFYPINRLFRASSSPEFVRLRNYLGLTLEIYSDWDSWTPCDACGKPPGKGITRRFGRCRIKVISTDINISLLKARDEERNLIVMSRVSCASISWSELFPYIGNLTRNLPNFQRVNYCKGVCKVDTKVSGWRSRLYKYQKSVVLVEGANLAIICPESDLDNTIIWRRNGMVLPMFETVFYGRDEEESHVIIDLLSTLHLRDVTTDESGNYTCQVDDIKMQQSRVYVISKNELLSQALKVQLISLAFIFCMYLGFCSGGLFLACFKWRSFKTYEQLRRESQRMEEALNFTDDNDSDWYTGTEDDEDSETNTSLIKGDTYV